MTLIERERGSSDINLDPTRPYSYGLWPNWLVEAQQHPSLVDHVRSISELADID